MLLRSSYHVKGGAGVYSLQTCLKNLHWRMQTDNPQFWRYAMIRAIFNVEMGKAEAGPFQWPFLGA
jgi:hypothetical protein